MNQEEREWDEYHDEDRRKTPRHDVHEPTTYELAEQELKAQERIERAKMRDYE